MSAQPAGSSRLLRARLQLMLTHPYLASAVARLPFVENDSWCQTMATDGYFIYVNAGFAASLPEAQVQTVIAHEVLHCVLGHIDRRGTRDPDLWNVAIDLATNLLLVDCGFEMPEVGLLDPKVRGMTAEQIYAMLAADPNAREAASAARVGAQRGMPRPGSPVLDVHLDDDDPRGAERRQADYPTQIERTRMRRELAAELSSQLRGHTAGLLAEEVRAAKSSEVPWQRLLAEFFTGLRRNDYRWLPPAKRHVWRGYYLPSIGQPGPRHIVVAIDTSGSIPSKMISSVLGEIEVLRGVTECAVTILQFDASVQHVHTYDPWEFANLDLSTFKIRGRGGTSFVPVFNWAREFSITSPESIDCIFVMTDGYGTFPKEAPGLPCVWMLPGTSTLVTPFGEVIRVSSFNH